jgi:organic hydroperoxide reductase OsmC/OhrA
MATHYGAPRTVPATRRQDTAVAAAARVFRYAIALDRAGRLTADGRAPLELAAAWTPEHLLLAGLARCTLQSLRFHAERGGADLVASASARGRVTKREADGRYAFVELTVDIELELEPVPAGAALPELLAKAERDCFVGASLQPPPTYSWRVNGSPV